jgi:caffeoyl-CoA O-methyltransferase
MAKDPKSFQLSADLHEYLVAHGSPPDAVKRSLIETTEKLGGISMMQIAPEQGAFMTLLARLMGARRAIEVGTFTGYSTLCLAEGVADDGVVIACDVSEEWTSIGEAHWEKAGVREKIELRIAPALATLQALPDARDFDLAFIDADKSNYLAYFEEIVRRIRPGGAILVDNVLWSGNVIDPDQNDPNTIAIREFNDRLADDPRVECTMLPISDGLTLARVI